MKEYKIYDNKPLDNYYKIMKNKNITHLQLGFVFNQRIDNLQISFSQEKKKFTNRRNKPCYIKSCYLPNS
jgi:hypothetical protein